MGAGRAEVFEAKPKCGRTEKNYPYCPLDSSGSKLGTGSIGDLRPVRQELHFVPKALNQLIL